MTETHALPWRVAELPEGIVILATDGLLVLELEPRDAQGLIVDRGARLALARRIVEAVNQRHAQRQG